MTARSVPISRQLWNRPLSTITATAPAATLDQRGSTSASSTAAARRTRKSPITASPPIHTDIPSTCTVRLAVASHTRSPALPWPIAAKVTAATSPRPASSHLRHTSREAVRNIRRSSGTARQSASSRISNRWPNRSSNVADSTDQRPNPLSPSPAAYGPCRSSCPRPASDDNPHAPAMSWFAPLVRSPCGQSSNRKKPAPRRTPIPA